MRALYPLSFIWKGKRPEDFGAYLYDIPEIGAVNEGYTSTVIPGRQGEIITPNGAIPNLPVNCTLGILNPQFPVLYRSVRQWLSGMGELTFFELPDSFYQVLRVEHRDVSRELRKFGMVNVTFVCIPYEFSKNGKYPIQINGNRGIYNPYDTCMPVYKINGEGMCTLIVNGSQMTANIGQNLTIDTRRMCAYRTDGTVQNTAVTGDYTDLRLNSGENAISITDGFNMEVIPFWGWNV